MTKNALLLSASREGDTGYLTHALPFIERFLNNDHHTISELLFIPFAGVTMSYDQYTQKVQQALSPLGIKVTGIHEHDDPIAAVKSAEAIAVGGGNTFELLNQLYLQNLIAPIQQAVASNCHYIGWSAGSNIAGLSIRTTNDMPIVQPQSFDALQLIGYLLNPHYTDYQAPGHNGETRQMRIGEFMVLNPDATVIGIQEGSALYVKDEQISLWGDKPAYRFVDGSKTTIEPGLL